MKLKNPTAAEMGKKGGDKAARKLNKAQRKARAKHAAKMRWKKALRVALPGHSF